MARQPIDTGATFADRDPKLNANFIELYASGASELTFTVVVNTPTYTIADLHSRIHVIYAGACEITVPTALLTDIFTTVVKDGVGNASVNNITIVGEGGELIDGESSLIINSDYDAVNLYSDTTNLFIY